MYLLDSNTCIQYINGTSLSVKENFRTHSGQPIAVCSVVKAELFYGGRKSQRVEANLRLLGRFFEPFKSLPFDDRCAEEYGQIKATLAAQGQLIRPMTC